MVGLRAPSSGPQRQWKPNPKFLFFFIVVVINLSLLFFTFIYCNTFSSIWQYVRFCDWHSTCFTTPVYHYRYQCFSFFLSFCVHSCMKLEKKVLRNSKQLLVCLKLHNVEHPGLECYELLLYLFFVFQVLHPLQQRFLNLINQENFAQICQEEAVKQEIVATLEALCGIAEATQIDNVASLFSFLMDFLSSCIGLMEVYQNSPETVNLIIEVFVEVAHKQICYLGEVS